MVYHMVPESWLSMVELLEESENTLDTSTLALQPHTHTHTQTRSSPQLEEETRDRVIVDTVKSTQRKAYRTDGKCPTMLGPKRSDIDLLVNQ